MTPTFRDLTDKFLAWSRKNQSARSTMIYEGTAKRFIAHLKDDADLPCDELKPYHINDYIAANDDWSNNYKQTTVSSICRIYNWGVSSGYIKENPVKTAFRAPKEGRKTYATAEDYNKIMGTIKPDDSFRDIVQFTWITGCRPQEARAIEVRHLYLDKGYILFPIKESKGKRKARRILLNIAASDLIKKNMQESGHVFRDSHGHPWSNFALCARFKKMQEFLGKPITFYSIRHSFATRKIKEGHSHIALAEIMGHANGNMIAQIYQHVGDDIEHLQKMLD